MACESYTGAGQSIEVWRPDEGMAGNGEAVGAKLIQRDQQHVWSHECRAYDGLA